MICAVIATSDPRDIAPRIAQARRSGADLVELRLDHCLDPDLALERAAASPLPWIATCRPVRDRGAYGGPEPERLALLHRAAVAGARYVDVEHGCEGNAGIAPGKLLLSHHDWERTPNDLPRLAGRLAQSGAALVKIATMARCYDDCRRLLELPGSSPVPMAALAMGSRGAITRIAYRKFGGALTYASLEDSEATAPGQVGLDALVSLYRAPAIGPTTRLFGITGSPVAKSLSPRLHNTAYRALGLDHCYLPFECDDLAELVACWRAAPTWDLGGLSVTMPHKESARHLADGLDRETPNEPAVNTLVAEGERLIGYNTDGPGALAAIASVLGEDWPRGRTVLVLGAGGAARTVGAALARAGAALVISTRRASEAQRLARDLGARVVPWELRDRERSALLVNATPSGMAPHEASSPLSAASLVHHEAVLDLVYVPRRTQLIADAEAAGCRVVLGSEMFLHQAALQLRLMTGCAAPLDLWRTLV